jgi:peptidoglycan/xylan/chitin deacetylase (PgdA/CDA1 family)
MLHGSNEAGLFRLLRESEWRRRQLLILCYHGISIEDEHEWAPGLYMSPKAFASRLEILKRDRYSVLPLGEAVHRLYDGTLPARSVVITFDDGAFDFHSRAWPLLSAYGYPATVYLTTYYCENNLAVFPLIVSYVLWKGRGAQIPFALAGGKHVTLDTRSPEGRRRAQNTLLLHGRDEGLSALDKDELANRLAETLDCDYAEMKRKRLLHIMNPREVAQLAAAGVDFQLHTHRHRSPLDRESYKAEVGHNRDRISALTGATPRHFCYPSGVCMPQFREWLEEDGAFSATTCTAGMATTRSDRFRLPRLLDHSSVTDVEFQAWLSGAGALLPRRRTRVQPVDDEGRMIIPRPAEEGQGRSAGSEATGAIRDVLSPAEVRT